MQQYPYAPYPNRNALHAPVGYIAAVPYPSKTGQRSTQPPAGLPRPPMAMMMPMMVPAPAAPRPMPHPQSQYYPYAQGYYSNPNAPNGVNHPGAFATNSKTQAKEIQKKGAKENKTDGSANALDGIQKHGLRGFGDNTDVNELLKHKGTKLKVSKIYRITKSKPGAVEESSEDEFEQVPLSSHRSPKKKPSAVPQSPPRGRTTMTAAPTAVPSHDSRCSTCSDCSECRYQNDKHGYDDCPECRAAYEHEHAPNRRHKRK